MTPRERAERMFKALEFFRDDVGHAFQATFTGEMEREFQSAINEAYEKAAKIAEQVADDAVQSRTIEIAEHAWIAREIATKLREEIKK